ncbi:MAG: NAD-dependent epimerase/dehydratase family protein [Dehalococcoidia bacterium]
MDILLLGGPQFVGRAVIDAALAGGHNVTMFNRGRTNPELYPEVERITGDRDGGLEGLAGRRWDAVVDTSGYLPRIVRQSAELLRDSVGRYLFVSTFSVYASMADADEDAPLATLADPAGEQITGETYGGLKVLCENVVQEVYGDNATVVRCGLIVGPHDHTDRFTYWPVHAARGGRMLAPEGPDYAMQVIDARDLAAFIVHLLETGTSGTFNASGPEPATTLGAILEMAAEVSGSKPEVAWHSTEFLQQHDVKPWSDLPLWLPGERWATAKLDRALAAGLMLRPMRETIADTLAWYAEERGQAPLRTGLSPEREAELLAMEPDS